MRKYIVTVDQDGNKEGFSFPDTINHKIMSNAIMSLLDKPSNVPGWKLVQRDTISAGFVEKGRCFGESVSLKLVANEEDYELFKDDY